MENDASKNDKQSEVAGSKNPESGVRKIFNKIRGIKNIQIIVAIFIIALALLIYSNVDRAKSKSAPSASYEMTASEQRLSRILSNIDGAGAVEAMITEQDGKVVGVLVIAEGADDITIRLRLIEAASSALGIDKAIIRVYGRK